MQLEQHVQGLNLQINELLGKLKTSNIKHTENTENVAFLQRKISTLEDVRSFQIFKLIYFMKMFELFFYFDIL